MTADVLYLSQPFAQHALIGATLVAAWTISCSIVMGSPEVVWEARRLSERPVPLDASGTGLGP